MKYFLSILSFFFLTVTLSQSPTQTKNKMWVTDIYLEINRSAFCLDCEVFDVELKSYEYRKFLFEKEKENLKNQLIFVSSLSYMENRLMYFKTTKDINHWGGKKLILGKSIISWKYIIDF